ncbi:16362_t:CDS:2 [Gigaspora margarita]|uniref:16362_t:CDS:1 n=1 Tax=Gigaspora margarita TaxID=4874 RepID=A0ABN7VKZ8_GIGMA|nr:16362_t:CDS:2 [Gigaspora margarita]
MTSTKNTANRPTTELTSEQYILNNHNPIKQKTSTHTHPWSTQDITAEINKLIAKTNGLAQCNIGQIDKLDLSTQKSPALIAKLK